MTTTTKPPTCREALQSCVDALLVIFTSHSIDAAVLKDIMDTSAAALAAPDEGGIAFGYAPLVCMAWAFSSLIRRARSK